LVFVALCGKLNVEVKVLSIDLPGELDNFQALWHLAEGLFYLKRRIFKNLLKQKNYKNVQQALLILKPNFFIVPQYRKKSSII